MSQYIWLIGGTSESVKIAELLSSSPFSCLVSVTTNAAQKLYAQIPRLNCTVDKIDSNNVVDFLKYKQIKLVIDASHPYAVTISQLAIAACQQQKIPYLRYERPLGKYSNSKGLKFSSVEAVLSSNYLEGKRVLLTLGYKSLYLFRNYHQRAELFARVLPYPESVIQAQAAGFTSKNLVAIRPPLSYELEKALWELWQIEVVVTKASGKAGGEDLKIELAEALKILLIIVSRPDLNYPQVTSSLEEVKKWCHCQWSII